MCVCVCVCVLALKSMCERVLASPPLIEVTLFLCVSVNSTQKKKTSTRRRSKF